MELSEADNSTHLCSPKAVKTTTAPLAQLMFSGNGLFRRVLAKTLAFAIFGFGDFLFWNFFH